MNAWTDNGYDFEEIDGVVYVYDRDVRYEFVGWDENCDMPVPVVRINFED